MCEVNNLCCKYLLKMCHRNKILRDSFKFFFLSVFWWFWYRFHTPTIQQLQPHTPVPWAQRLAQQYVCRTQFKGDFVVTGANLDDNCQTKYVLVIFPLHYGCTDAVQRRVQSLLDHGATQLEVRELLDLILLQLKVKCFGIMHGITLTTFFFFYDNFNLLQGQPEIEYKY